MADNEEPSPSRHKKLSVFALAIASPNITAEIEVGDVLELRPAWTEHQAEAFLCEHADTIGAAMILRGIEMLNYILGGDENVQ